MQERKLEKTGLTVGEIGLGAMPLSLDRRPAEKEATEVIHRALDLGVTLIDTADSYCINEEDKHHNEKLIAQALRSYSKETDRVVVATKGGLMRPGGDWTVNGDPEHLKKTIRESFEALGGERPISLWQLHAVDPKFPIEESLRAVKEAVDEGRIRCVGLSNVSVREIERARKVVDVVSVQNRYNLWELGPERDGVLSYCEKEGLAFLPWSPLGGSTRFGRVKEIGVVREIAEKRKVSVYQVVLAWLMSKSPCLIPIPGASHLSSIEDSVKAGDLRLSKDEIAQVNHAGLS